ncbi:MAG: hypothetical protein JWN79_3456 [Gemmatimonadetes bacterium]|jgi:hypothetical protein|nr:hypothetical protein [Gemmatimonadota bacterium]
MKHQIRFALLATAFTAFAAGTAHAQGDAHKPGGLNKVAHDVSNTVKKAGRDTKAEVHRDASRAHNTLTDAGNGTKTVLKKTTGIHGSHNAHPGGLNKVAHDVSNASKKAGSQAKGEVQDAKSAAHGALTEKGKSIKDTTLRNAKP